ncbi:MAG: hypothetical protein M5U28_30410 [Sandaracinaceae bacterium]|nr:hypothetical protein [Sandaracinaceae bacterium]
MPADVLFFDVLGEGDGAVYYGSERAPREDEPPRIFEIHAGARNPAKALRSQLLLDKLLLFARSAEEADDYDVYSKETYASIQAVRRAPQPPFELRWEYGTPGLPQPPPPPEPAPTLPSRVRHAKFGEGTVVARTGSGENEKLDVAFDSGVRKTLLARFVTSV